MLHQSSIQSISEVDRESKYKDENNIMFELFRKQKRTVLAASQCFGETRQNSAKKLNPSLLEEREEMDCYIISKELVPKVKLVLSSSSR